MPPVLGPPRPNWLTHPSRQGRSQQPLHREPPIAIFSNALYYPNWRIYRQQPPSTLNLGFVSHVFYAFARSVWVESGKSALSHFR